MTVNLSEESKILRKRINEIATDWQAKEIENQQLRNRVKKLEADKSPELKEGEIYAGAIINSDGTGHHIILLDGDKEAISWQDAMEWAKELGGDLPTRAELILLYENYKDQFEERAYWSNTQHASSSVYAWYQHFYYGNQVNWLKNTRLRARAVRRVSIGETK